MTLLNLVATALLRPTIVLATPRFWNIIYHEFTSEFVQRRQNKENESLSDEQLESVEKDDIAFSPLAMPILSGPGAIAVMIGMATDAKEDWFRYVIIVTVIALVSYSCYIFMRLAPQITQRMGTTMVKSFTRIMGFLLLCIGVQYIVNGVTPLLKSIVH